MPKFVPIIPVAWSVGWGRCRPAGKEITWLTMRPDFFPPLFRRAIENPCRLFNSEIFPPLITSYAFFITNNYFHENYVNR